MTARFLHTEDDGTQSAIGEIVLAADGRLTQTLPEALWESISSFGVIGLGGIQQTIEDGEAFMQALAVEFSGSRLRVQLEA